MSKNKAIAIVSLVCLTLGVSSCRKFLNVNTSPNKAQSASVQTLLPAAELYVGSAVGVDLEIDGSFWAQYWTQSPSASQYTNLDKYTIGQDGFSYPWGNLYSAAENFYQVAILADSVKKKQYQAIAVLMQAYTFQLITDGWGDVPFRQALKGQYTDGHVVNPAYDSQAVIYRGIITLIDSANKLINTNDPIHPGADDLIYGGDMSKWQEFSNTLKLKVYMRMSEIDPTTAQAGIIALYASPNHSFIGIPGTDDAKIAYGFNTANKNPLYAEESGLNFTQNLVASSSCVDSMNSNNDYRLFAFYEPNTGGSFVGLAQGIIANNITLGSYSIPTTYVGGDAQNSASTSAPVNLMTSYESYFLQAEVAARGWVSGDDAGLFYNGIQASFEYYGSQISSQVGITGDSAYTLYVNGDVPNAIPPGYWATYPAGGSVQQKVQFIITQKWFSMCGNQGFEAWCELRRTGYPNFLPFPLFATPKAFPKRFLYPTTESTVNLSYPGLAPLTSKMWWDLN